MRAVKMRRPGPRANCKLNTVSPASYLGTAHLQVYFKAPLDGTTPGGNVIDRSKKVGRVLRV